VGGTIEQPLVAAPWGDTFGSLRDKYGVKWMVNITPKRG
jgi:PhnB protein